MSTTLRRKKQTLVGNGNHGEYGADRVLQTASSSSSSSSWMKKYRKSSLPIQTKIWKVFVVAAVLVVATSTTRSLRLQSQGLQDNNLSNSPSTTKRRKARHRIEPTLAYGVEFSYLPPITFLEEVTAAYNNVLTKNNIRNGTSLVDLIEQDVLEQDVHQQLPGQEIMMEGLTSALKNYSIHAGQHGHRIRVPNSWTISIEHHIRLEIASDISPPKQDIRHMIQVLNETNFQIDPEFTATHINIDARNRSAQEIRNVYKNFVAVEGAIEMIRTTSRVKSAGKAVSMGGKYDSTQKAFQAMDDPLRFRYPAWDRRTLPDGSIIKNNTGGRPVLRLTMNDETLQTRTLEFRGIQPSLDFDVVWAWVQFARKFVQVSFEGIVLEPKQRTPEQQWEVLFGELIQDDQLEATLSAWRQNILIPLPNRDLLIDTFCPLLRPSICNMARRGLGKRKRRERQRERRRDHEERHRRKAGLTT